MDAPISQDNPVPVGSPNTIGWDLVPMDFHRGFLLASWFACLFELKRKFPSMDWRVPADWDVLTTTEISDEVSMMCEMLRSIPSR